MPRALLFLAFLLSGGAWLIYELVGPSTRILASIDRGLLLDGASVAFLKIGDPDAADAVVRDLAGASGRAPGDFRLRLLRAHIERSRATRGSGDSSGRTRIRPSEDA